MYVVLYILTMIIHNLLITIGQIMLIMMLFMDSVEIYMLPILIIKNQYLLILMMLIILVM